MKIKFESQLHVQRLVLGMLCGLLPICCLLFGLFGADTNPTNWWHSISATYYASSCVWMIGSLVLASFFFLTYSGYDTYDKVLTRISSVAAISIVVFPCYMQGFTNVGLFALPVNISGTIHNIAAATLFISFALMILTQFTKGKDRKRNLIYGACGSVIILFMLNQVITTLVDAPGYWTMINEFFMLEAFAVAWITKSRVHIVKTSEEVTV